MKILVLVCLLVIASIFGQHSVGQQLPNQWSHFYNDIEINDQIELNNQIYLATDIGLFQIDKSTEVVSFFNKENSSLPDNHIQTLSKDLAGNLWIGTYNIAMVMAPSNGAAWTVINYPTLANSLTVYSSDIGPNGDLWLGCNQGLLQYDGQNWTQHTLSCSSSNIPVVWDVKVNSTGKVFAGSFNLITLENGQCTEINGDSTFSFMAYGDACLSLLNDTTIFFLADHQFIRKFDGHTWQSWSVGSDLQGGINFGAVNPVLNNNAEFTYLASDNILLSYDGQTWQKDSSLYTSAQSTGLNYMQTVVLEPNGDFWAFNKNKLLRQSNGNQSQQELVELKAYSTYAKWTTDRNGQVYGYNNADQILKINGTIWDTLYVNYGSLGPLLVQNLFFDQQNDKWVSVQEITNWTYRLMEELNGTWVLHDSASSGGVLPADKRFFMVFTSSDNRTVIRDTDLNYYQYYNGSWSPVNWLSSSANYSGFQEDDNGATWFVERTYVNSNYIYQLKKFNGTSVDAYPFPQNSSAWSMGTTIDYNGHVWVHGPQDTLYEFDGTNFIAHAYPAATGTPHALILKGNHKFLGIYGLGVLHYDGNSWNLIDKSNSGMSSNNISTLLLNENGDLWMAYNYTDVVDVWHSNLSTAQQLINQTDADDLKVYPNPVQHTLMLETSLQDATLELYDMHGRLLISTTMFHQTQSLNTEQLPVGTYLVRVRNKQHSQQKMILKY